jgi:hypothetical protein
VNLQLIQLRIQSLQYENKSNLHPYKYYLTSVAWFIPCYFITSWPSPLSFVNANVIIFHCSIVWSFYKLMFCVLDHKSNGSKVHEFNLITLVFEERKDGQFNLCLMWISFNIIHPTIEWSCCLCVCVEIHILKLKIALKLSHYIGTNCWSILARIWEKKSCKIMKKKGWVTCTQSYLWQWYWCYKNPKIYIYHFFVIFSTTKWIFFQKVIFFQYKSN